MVKEQNNYQQHNKLTWKCLEIPLIVSKERNKRPLLKDMHTMSAAPVRCISSKSELDPDLDIRGGGGERGDGQPDPNIRAWGQTPKNFF